MIFGQVKLTPYVWKGEQNVHDTEWNLQSLEANRY